MQRTVKMLVMLFVGAAMGTAVSSVVIGQPSGEGSGPVTWEDLAALREVRSRIAATADTRAGLPLSDDTPKVVLLAVGDVMLSRGVALKMKANGYGYPFLAMRDELRAADITFGNLESPIVAGREIQPFEMAFRADPACADSLADSGFDVMSLANNHTMNFGPHGLSETVRFLDGAGIVHVGAGTDAAAATASAAVERNGLRFAFLAYTYDSRGASAGTAPLDVELVSRNVAAAKEAADFVVVSMHAGEEYAAVPNARQREFAHAAVDAGADLVIGHHPHVVQTAEIYRGKHVFYSLGNFVFDQMWSDETRHGLAIKLTFLKSGVRDIEFLPVRIDDFAQPRPLERPEAESVISRLGDIYLNANTDGRTSP